MEQQFDLIAETLIPNYFQQHVPYEEMAVLCKYNDDIKSCSKVFDALGIPYYVAKREFKRTDLVKWLEDCASWVTGNKSVSFDELFSFWQKFLIEHNQTSYNENQEAMNRRSLYELLSSSSEESEILHKWLNNIFTDLMLVDILKNSVRYPDELDNLSLVYEMAMEDTFSDFKISQFGNLGKPWNQVTITTRHSSKGLEFEVIFLVGMEEGNFPDYRTVDDMDKIAEQNRICFVCVSRAKKACVMLRSMVHVIPTKRGPWRKDHEASRYWVMLKERYGN